MSKIYVLAGCFLLGASISGLVSYSAYTFPQLRGWAFWLLVVVAAVFVVAALTDDHTSQWLGLSYQSYIALMCGLALTLLLGGVIQWQ